MLESGVKAYEWANATQGIVGQIVYLTSAGKLDYDTGIAIMPRGVLLNAPKQGEQAQVNFPDQGDLVLMLADGTTDIAIGDKLKSNSTGRAIKAGAKSPTYVATETWIVGQAEQAFTTNGDGLILVRWDKHEGSWT